MSLGLGIGIGLRRSRIAVGTQWDADAVDYLARVAIADGQALENEVALAANDLFVALKDPAFPTPTLPTHWQAVLAGQFLPLCGARTLAGALLPLHSSMPMPTNVNFVPGDYNRKTGLQGDGASKEIDMVFFPSTLPQDDIAMGCVPSFVDANYFINSGRGGTGATAVMGLGRHRSRNSTFLTTSSPALNRLHGHSRHDGAGYLGFAGSAVQSFTIESQLPHSSTTKMFNCSVPPDGFSSARLRLGFVSASVDLTYMDEILVNYLTALAAAIP